ncbi:hypothetical protein MMAN_58200 [Mycobacterium mantenii]|uniref:DUF4189 domain-containing protein n=1 Tax=Mycobacterium mantenii TaxID=560555 RepID=A0ABN6AJ51_MYCNT|nr:hypothetical protein MMAN_58200 [Mycobacterium mantenii]
MHRLAAAPAEAEAQYYSLTRDRPTGRLTEPREQPNAVDQCNASTGGVCEAVAGMHNGCASVAIDPDAGRFQGGYGSDTTASNADALTELDSPSGVIAASHCSS